MYVRTRFEGDRRLPVFLAAMALATVATMTLIFAGSASVGAQAPGQATKPAAPKEQASPLTNQVISGFPMTITVEDNGRMRIDYRDLGNQFYGGDAEGVYLWVNVAGTTTVFGPGHVPAGLDTIPYIPVSNNKTGSGTPSDPWVVTTVNTVPSTTLRLTQRTSYVNGAEFTPLTFKLEQIGGTQPVTATLFHAADLYTAGSDQGYGFYDPSTGAVGDYFTPTHGILNGSTLFQQFVPTTAANAYKESYYNTIWSDIGDTSGPGPGFDNTIISDTLHDSGTGLQWNLTVPATTSVTVGDTDLFSPHQSLCGSFSDVPYGSFYYDYIYYLACHGIVSGYSDTTFRPNNNATRAQISKMAVLSAGWTLYTPPTPSFTDVPASNPFYAYIETAHQHGIIAGYANGSFQPNNLVTRGQTTKIVVGFKGWTIDTTGGPHFTDVPTTNPFYSWIETAFNKGVISGYGDHTFRWGNNVTRAQLGKVLYLAIHTATDTP
jgi:hypothetical protein